MYVYLGFEKKKFFLEGFSNFGFDNRKLFHLYLKIQIMYT